jgi:bifunctional non-homologous end joining protein LigD
VHPIGAAPRSRAKRGKSYQESRKKAHPTKAAFDPLRTFRHAIGRLFLPSLEGGGWGWVPPRFSAALAGRERRRGSPRSAVMVWTPEPTYEKPDISVRATTLYYQIVAPIMLPFLDSRLLNLFRCRDGKCFFQRNRDHPPTGKEFDKLVHLEPVAQKNGRTEDYLYVTSVDEIIACAKVQSIEFHGWGSRAGAVETPDRLVIDLDPDPKLGFEAVKRAAFQVHRSFATVGLDSFALLSGGKGIHIVAPLEPAAEWDEVRDFAKTFCTALAEAAPERFTVALPKLQRRGRIFLDFLRNQRTATAIMPYSARARVCMPVAAPVTWDELEAIDRSDAFTIADVGQLLERAKSPSLGRWAVLGQRLPRLQYARR